MTPIPAPVLDELLTCARVEFDRAGNLTLMELPRASQVPALLNLCGGKQLSHSVDEILFEVECGLWKAMPRMRLAARQAHGTPKPEPRVPPPGVARFYAPPVTATSWEARIKTMPYSELAELLARHGVTYKLEAPNGGILTMRARNAAYNWMKQGNTFKN